LATQDWKIVAPLIANAACVTFFSGIVHQGKSNVQSAFEHNFKLIKSEKYTIKNVRWVSKNDAFAVYFFEYHWVGLINDKLLSVTGIGTAVIVNENGKWKLLTEHLGNVSP